MAMYENEGYCPNNSFMHYCIENEVPTIWERTEEILGDRPGYMVYTKNGVCHEGYSYVVDCLVGSTSRLGFDVACKLKELIPNCKYAEIGRKILVTDVSNSFGNHGLDNYSKKMDILEDDRYTVGIIDEDEAVHLYFLKKMAG